MLVGLAILQYAGDMQSAFVGKGAVANVRLPLIRLNVGQLIEEMRYLTQLPQLIRLDAVLAHLQLQIRNQRYEIEIAAAFAKAVDRSLNLALAHLNRRHGVGNRELAVI